MLQVALGPNQVIAPKPSSQVVTPKPPSQNQSRDTGPTPHTPPIADMSPPTDPLIKMISSAYLTFNASRPDLTNGCWLCYIIRPPYYEAVAFSSGFNVAADISACRWQQQPSTGRLTTGPPRRSRAAPSSAPSPAKTRTPKPEGKKATHRPFAAAPRCRMSSSREMSAILHRQASREQLRFPQPSSPPLRPLWSD
ncbi:hypothetical protein Celaphus_00010183 [Cervus elaphus hippelaphus]|uniref:Uncharacterized protein n=1 Tax=Cervus elaphus hippelaphus TaxID=46360 RepID=A0A212C969_CEREH|nr:hypothetical protein Celaphus_00010183 [Cervus elaphus hippelaphus]